MPIPEPTNKLCQRLRRVGILLDAIAAQAKTERAYRAANDGANTIWIAIHRIEELAGIVEDIAPADTLDDEADYPRPVNKNDI